MSNLSLKSMSLGCWKSHKNSYVSRRSHHFMTDRQTRRVMKKKCCVTFLTLSVFCSFLCVSLCLPTTTTTHLMWWSNVFSSSTALLRKTKGRIINMSGAFGRYTVPTEATYCATKHALESYSDGLRRELTSLDVSVSIIEPGFVQSPMHGKYVSTREVSVW